MRQKATMRRGRVRASQINLICLVQSAAGMASGASYAYFPLLPLLILPNIRVTQFIGLQITISALTRQSDCVSHVNHAID